MYALSVGKSGVGHAGPHDSDASSYLYMQYLTYVLPYIPTKIFLRRTPAV